MSTVLVVEDDTPLRTALRAGLRAQSMDVIDVASGAEAIAVLTRSVPDLVLLDLNLPDVDGFAVLTRTRELSQVPVVVLTVREDRADKIRALDAGADDYITKPFDADELYARLRAALRRNVDDGPVSPIAEAHGVMIDLGAGRVTRDGQAVRLTKAEWKVLALLVREAGGLVTHGRLLEELRRPADADVTSLRVHVNHIRRKLGDDGGRALLIVNEPGLGYRWLPEPELPDHASNVPT
jgi:two-component system, OmpR family, KDP operon response regulator KdpE